MTGLELAYLGFALSGVGLFLFVVRRAARKNLGDSGRGAQPRLETRTAEPDEAPPKRRTSARKRPEEIAKKTPPARERDEQEDEQEDEQPAEGDDADAEVSDALRAGLAKTRGGFIAKLGKLFAGKKIDDDVLGELEEVLFTADIGPKTAQKLFAAVKDELSRTELEDADAIWSKLKQRSTDILSVDTTPIDFSRERPFVLLTIGVNGVGKTTTIGKIASKLTSEGKSVMLAAGDTFRAAAVEQLEVWGERSGCTVVKGKSGGDPSSVIFDAIKKAQEENIDVLIADTAGRLHTKVDLMDELKKVGRVVDKAMPGAPHETFLVLDATTGQNAIQQAEIFKQTMDITGIVLTKLDGTAKGGVILGIADELGVPVRYIGIGEQIADLREFDAEAFVEALYAHEQADAA